MQARHEETTYIPGQCNIGPEEILKRKRIGWLGVILMALYILIVEIFHLPPVWKLGIFIPAAYGASGFLQMRQHFCLVYGLFGLYSFNNSRKKIKDRESVSKDLQKVIVIVAQIFAISGGVTLLYYFIC